MIIMTNFYRLVASKNYDSSDALRLAQLELFNRAGRDLPVYFSHPLFWAVFTPMGDGITKGNAE